MTSAATIATQLDRTVAAITERIASLEKASYTGAGKQAVSDPQMERLNMMVEGLSRKSNLTTGKSEGISTSWSFAAAAIALVIAAGSWLGPRPAAIAAPAPQIIYLPAPTTPTLGFTTK